MVLHFVYVLAKQYIFITDGFLTGSGVCQARHKTKKNLDT